MKRVKSKLLGGEEIIFLERGDVPNGDLGDIVIYTYREQNFIHGLGPQSLALLHMFKKEFNGTIERGKAYEDIGRTQNSNGAESGRRGDYTKVPRSTSPDYKTTEPVYSSEDGFEFVKDYKAFRERIKNTEGEKK